VHYWRVTMITREEIDIVGPIDPKLAALWSDVQFLADSVHAHTGAERDLAWHHLLLAVGNYKAQAPLFVLAFPSAPEHRTVQREQTLAVRIGGELLEVSAEGPSTWRELMVLIRGLGIPRTTTVLSALWPGQHVIMDWRALSASLALSGARLGWDQSLVGPASTTRAEASWTSYDWYRRAVVCCADRVGRSPVDLERALWQVGREAPGLTWEVYAELLEHDLAHWPRDAGPRLSAIYRLRRQTPPGAGSQLKDRFPRAWASLDLQVGCSSAALEPARAHQPSGQQGVRRQVTQPAPAYRPAVG
jgi:hypothetical protein